MLDRGGVKKKGKGVDNMKMYIYINMKQKVDSVF